MIQFPNEFYVVHFQVRHLGKVMWFAPECDLLTDFTDAIDHAIENISLWGNDLLAMRVTWIAGTEVRDMTAGALSVIVPRMCDALDVDEGAYPAIIANNGGAKYQAQRLQDYRDEIRHERQERTR